MKLTVRNYHLDGYGHVNNARYLEFLEEARWTFFQEHDLLSELKGIMLVVARVDIYNRVKVVHKGLEPIAFNASFISRFVLRTPSILFDDTISSRTSPRRIAPPVIPGMFCMRKETFRSVRSIFSLSRVISRGIARNNSSFPAI